VLSGGEKSRLALAKLIYSRANVLILDEPTNHLDIPSREALESAIEDYPGTIITVSHDRYFLDRIATEILHFERGVATYHTGSYSDYHSFRQQKETEVRQQQTERRAAQDQQKRRPARPKKDRGRSAEEIEKEIHTLESELGQLNDKLSSPAADWGPQEYAEIGNRQNALSSRLDELYREWEEALAGSAS
jgi:ATP-binding cassette subfamily F protein 3